VIDNVSDVIGITASWSRDEEPRALIDAVHNPTTVCPPGDAGQPRDNPRQLSFRARNRNPASAYGEWRVPFRTLLFRKPELINFFIFNAVA